LVDKKLAGAEYTRDARLSPLKHTQGSGVSGTSKFLKSLLLLISYLLWSKENLEKQAINFKGTVIKNMDC
jgi:hypothetical protein